MTPAELAAFDRAVQVQLDLLRHSSSVEGQTLRMIENMRQELMGKLGKGKLTEWNKSRLNAMLKETNSVISATYDRVSAQVAKSYPSVVEIVAKENKLAIASLEVTLNSVDSRLGYKLVNLDVSVFDKEWAKNKDFYVGPEGAGGIGKRYENVIKYIQDNSSFEASSVVVNSDGSIGFENGRHRYAALRDAGNKVIPVAMHPDSVANAEQYGYLSSGPVSPFEVSMSTGVPSANLMAAIIKDTLIEGAPSASWWSRQSLDTAFKFSNAIRQGIAQGETNEQIFRRVKAVTDLAGRNSRALVQTSIMQVAGDSRVALVESNSDIYSGFRQLSTLDGHTTPQCIARSNLVWNLEKEPVGHKLPFKSPPIHWGCRSVMVGVLKTFKELGIGLKEPAGLTRSSAEGQISKKTTFDSFLSRRTVDQQDEQLGRGKAQLWRDGKITLRQLVDNHGNPLTLEQLKAKYE